MPEFRPARVWPGYYSMKVTHLRATLWPDYPEGHSITVYAGGLLPDVELAASFKLWQLMVKEAAKGEPIRVLAYSSGARLLNHVYNVWGPWFELFAGIPTPRAKRVVFAGATVPDTDPAVANNSDRVVNYWSSHDGVSFIFPGGGAAGSKPLAGKGVHNMWTPDMFHGDWMKWNKDPIDMLLEEYAEDLKD